MQYQFVLADDTLRFIDERDELGEWHFYPAPNERKLLQKLDYSRQQIREKMRKMNNGEPISAPRLFAGKKRNKSVGLFIQDEYGNDRIRIYVDDQNKPQIEFLDKQGEKIPLNNLK